jgi:hypothetical protein
MRRPFTGSRLVTGDTSTHAQYGVGPASDYAMGNGDPVLAPFAGQVTQFRTPEGGYSVLLTNGPYGFVAQHLGIDRVSGYVGEGAHLAGISNSGSLWSGYHLHDYFTINGRRVSGEEFAAELGYVAIPVGQYASAGFTRAAGGGTEPIQEEDDLMELKRIIFDQGPSSAAGWASTAVIDPFTGFIKTSEGTGPRAELDAWTAVANALGFKVTESHVDANGWILAQRFRSPVSSGAGPDASALASAVNAVLLDDFAGVGNTITLSEARLYGKIAAALEALNLELSDQDVERIIADLDIPTAAETAKAVNDDAANRLKA